MTDILRPVLELFVIIPGILLAYLPVKNYLRQTPLKLTAWLLPLLLGICILGGAVCCALQIPTRWFLFPLLPVIMLIYHKTLKISVWKSVSIFLAVFAVFTCVKSLSRAVNALMTADLHITENELWLHTGAGIFYNVICLLFVLAAWYPACHCVQTMVTDENFAQTWYVFWILPVIFIGVNLFMIYRAYSAVLYCFQSCTAHNPASVLCPVSYDGSQPEQKCQTSAGEPFSFPSTGKIRESLHGH